MNIPPPALPDSRRRAPAAILHYTGYQQTGGGILSVLAALSPNLPRGILGVGDRYPHARHGVWRTCRLPAGEAEHLGGRTVLRTARLAWGLRWRAAFQSRPTLFHGHSRAGLLVALWLWWMGDHRARVTVHVLGRQRWLYRWAAILLGERLVWLGPGMKRHYDGGASSWQQCVPDCLPDNVAPNLPSPARPRAPRVIGCVGTLVPVKQWELALQALALVPPAIELRLLHAGGEDGSPESAAYARSLHQRTTALGLETRVEWLGHVADMAAFYRRLDVLLVPSEREAASVAALEAIAHGVPVCAPDCGGTRDLVDALQAGYLFSTGDSRALADLLSQLDGHLPAFRIGAPGKLRCFHSAAVGAQYAALYQADDRPVI